MVRAHLFRKTGGRVWDLRRQWKFEVSLPAPYVMLRLYGYERDIHSWVPIDFFFGYFIGNDDRFQDK